MALSAATRALLADGVWASDDDADRRTPEAAGLDRATGYPPSYEQLNSGKNVERDVFNNHLYEITAALTDVFTMGVALWAADVDYEPDDDAQTSVVTATGRWYTDRNTGPSHGGAVNPDEVGQQVWRRF